MRRLGLIVLVAVCLVLQVSFLPALRPFGVVPDLALVLVVLICLEGTASVALVVAVISGLVLDLASGANFGLWTAILVLAALSGGLLHRAGVELGGPAVAVTMVAIGTVLVAAVILSQLVSVVGNWPVGMLLWRLGSELVLNLGLVMVVRPLVRMVAPGTAVSIATVQ